MHINAYFNKQGLLTLKVSKIHQDIITQLVTACASKKCDAMRENGSAVLYIHDVDEKTFNQLSELTGNTHYTYARLNQEAEKDARNNGQTRPSQLGVTLFNKTNSASKKNLNDVVYQVSQLRKKQVSVTITCSNPVFISNWSDFFENNAGVSCKSGKFELMFITDQATYDKNISALIKHSPPGFKTKIPKKFDDLVALSESSDEEASSRKRARGTI